MKKTYAVKGLASVLVETVIHVEANSPAEAKELSRSVFLKQKQRCIIGNSTDYSSVYDYQPGDAEIYK